MEQGGGERDGKRNKMCFISVLTSPDDCNCNVLSTHTNKKEASQILKNVMR